MKKLIKRIIERLYYKCYPERKKEHEIEWTPMPIITETKAGVVNFTAQVILPMEVIARDNVPIEWIRLALADKIGKMVDSEIEIQYKKDDYMDNMIYTGTLRVLRRR